MLRRRVETVYGHALPESRTTLTGRLLAVLYLGLPTLALLLLFDLIVWAFFEATTGACVALWCVF